MPAQDTRSRPARPVTRSASDPDLTVVRADPALTIARVMAGKVFTSDAEIRALTLPEQLDVIDNLIPPGAGALVGSPGLGKTFMAQILEHHAAYGTPLAGWPAPEALVNALVIDGESALGMVQSRSYSITSWLPSDDGNPAPDQGVIDYITDGTTGHPCMPEGTFSARMMWLEIEIQERAEAGRPLRMITIDTFTQWIGSPRDRMSMSEWQTHCAWETNKLALKYDVAVLYLHHPSRSGDVSGAVGFEGGLSFVLTMKRNDGAGAGGAGSESPDRSDEVHLCTKKIRDGVSYDYALRQDPTTGVYAFTDQVTATQVQYDGLPRLIVDHLTKVGRATPAEIALALKHRPEHKPATIKRRLQRLADRGELVKERVYYRLVTDRDRAGLPPLRERLCQGCATPMRPLITPDQLTHPGCAPEPVNRACRACGRPMISTSVDDYHPGCAPVPAAAEPAPAPAPAPPAPAAGDTAPDVDEPTMVGDWNADEALLRSIMRSKLNPLPNMFDQLDQEPFNLITEQMDGQHHQWKPGIEIPDGATVSILDRRKSYLATASEVYVAPNRLTHTGPLEGQSGRAGLFLIAPVEWPHLDRIAHPLGWTAGNGVDPILIMTPHLRLLEKLHSRTFPSGERELPCAPVILDSWTGRTATNLFKPFGQEAKEVLLHGGPEMVDALKVGYGKAVRKLWAKTVYSKTVRPDWHQSWEAEAACRNWVVAWNAVKAGETLIRIANVDATHWISPADADMSWCPANYSIGETFGCVQHKSDVAIKDIGPDGKARRTATGALARLHVSSPVTPELYGRRFH